MNRLVPALICPVILFAPSLVAQGVEQTWGSACINCHGQKGQGGGAGTVTLLSPELMSQDLDRRFFDAIKSGIETKGMPAFGETLSTAQMWALVNHIRALQHNAYRDNGGGPKEQGGIYRSTHAKYKLETVVGGGLETPWSVDFLPTGEMLVTERPGSLRVFRNGKLSEPVGGLPKVYGRGQGGLMDVAVHPEYPKNGWVFLAFSDADESGKGNFTKVVRGRIKPAGNTWSWVDEKTIFEARPAHYVNSDLHFGCRIVFDPKDPSLLYFCIGERGQGKTAQDLTLPSGKIFRVKTDGSIPTDNPFVSQQGAYGQIWSFGHRNPQGLCFDLDGNLWETEHGPRGGDELNLIKKGRNYGWPIVSFGIEYSGAPRAAPWPDLVPEAKGKDIAMPTYRWLPSSAACGLDVVRPGPKGEAFPQWKGDLLSGGLAGNNVERLRVKVNADGTTGLVEREELLFGKGRVRDVVSGPDGSIYVVLNDPHKVIRLVPATP